MGKLELLFIVDGNINWNDLFEVFKDIWKYLKWQQLLVASCFPPIPISVSSFFLGSGSPNSLLGTWPSGVKTVFLILSCRWMWPYDLSSS